MALMTSLFNILLISVISSQVQALVCYLSQEPDAEKGYRWYIDEKNPCECTEFRMGGLNNKPHPGPSKVYGIHYVPFKTNKEKIREVLECVDAIESPCDQFTAPLGGLQKVSKLNQVLPMEIELTIDGQEGVYLYFTTENPMQTGEAPFTVELGPDVFSATCYTPYDRVTSDRNPPITGSAVMMTVTFNGVSISVGLKGKTESYISCNSTIPTTGSEWFISLNSYLEDTILSIYKPCGLVWFIQ